MGFLLLTVAADWLGHSVAGAGRGTVSVEDLPLLPGSTDGGIPAVWRVVTLIYDFRVIRCCFLQAT